MLPVPPVPAGVLEEGSGGGQLLGLQSEEDDVAYNSVMVIAQTTTRPATIATTVNVFCDGNFDAIYFLKIKVKLMRESTYAAIVECVEHAGPSTREEVIDAVCALTESRDQFARLIAERFIVEIVHDDGRVGYPQKRTIGIHPTMKRVFDREYKRGTLEKWRLSALDHGFTPA
jgi:hypothetical protein